MAEGKGKGKEPVLATAVEKEGEVSAAAAAEKKREGAVVSEAEAGKREEESGRMITLNSSDGESFVVTEASASLSNTIAEMIEAGSADPYIPLPIVDSKTLKKLIDYCDKHTGDTDKEELKKWDNGFITELVKDKDFLLDVIKASNYTNIDGLLDLTCKAVADMIKGKTSEEIRAAFNIKNDFTEEEEEEIRRDNAWAFTE